MEREKSKQQNEKKERFFSSVKKKLLFILWSSTDQDDNHWRQFSAVRNWVPFILWCMIQFWNFFFILRQPHFSSNVEHKFYQASLNVKCFWEFNGCTVIGMEFSPHRQQPRTSPTDFRTSFQYTYTKHCYKTTAVVVIVVAASTMKLCNSSMFFFSFFFIYKPHSDVISHFIWFFDWSSVENKRSSRVQRMSQTLNRQTNWNQHFCHHHGSNDLQLHFVVSQEHSFALCRVCSGWEWNVHFRSSYQYFWFEVIGSADVTHIKHVRTIIRFGARLMVLI